MSGIASAQVHVELKEGSAREQIVRSAIDWMPDKIIVGAHGYAPNRLFGAVPRAVAIHAPCSVELIKTDRN